MKPTMLTIGYSPWSERVRWVRDLRGVDVAEEPYAPLLGELRLSRLRRGVPGPTSVPVLLTDEGPLGDSLAIARWLDARGTRGEPLFPPGQDDAITCWNALSERALAAARSSALRRTLARPEALDALVPRSMRALGPVARAIAAFGERRTLRKYDAPSEEAARPMLRAELDVLRAHLASRPAGDRGVKTILDRFSYADVTAAQALAMVTPPATGIRVREATRASYVDAEIAAEYADLLAWRDALYAAWRT